MNHLNVVIDGLDDTVDHFRDRYGAQFLGDVRYDEWHAGFIAVAGVILELFAPHDNLLHTRFGPHWIGVEYQVSDMVGAREAVAARGVRIIRDKPNVFHTHPADGFGIAFELYGGSFHEEPSPIPNVRESLKPLEYWRDEHPLGCLGLKRYSVVVTDLDGACQFFQDFTGATVVYREERSAIGARAVGLALADTVVELLTPTADGRIQAFHARYRDGIRSCVLAVTSID
jgi:hypothetical protein